MTSTELIKDMLERQKAYDEEVFKKHNVDYVSKAQLESALFDELGELMHAQKSDWCWWKFTQEEKDPAKVFEEYIDVVHFALMYEIKFGSGCYQYEDIKWNYNKLKTDLGFGQAYAFSCVISLTRDDNVLAYVIALGLHLGYSFGEIYNEYIRKNEINKERLAKGYQDMWIRSQNRMQLQDVNRFVIERFETGIYIVGNGCTLGIYSTKEKALKVLDQIQYNIELFDHEPTMVFQMPQDEEVEI